MIAMQYRIQLPADYDMRIIRRRVAERGSALDDCEGLAFKAYLIREISTHGDNAYAPFYLWRKAEAMSSFLVGLGFRQLCSDFGRPVVKSWNVAKFLGGASLGDEPAQGRLSVSTIPTAQPLATGVATELALVDTRETDALHSAIVGFDLRSSELIRFELWAADAPRFADGEAFASLHLSSPEIAYA